ncbi:MAG: hypothetical protein M3N95_13075 [Actinomycetota bacterium]|nr:hypothetical protein [Actinomycetota bacterium]
MSKAIRFRLLATLGAAFAAATLLGSGVANATTQNPPGCTVVLSVTPSTAGQYTLNGQGFRCQQPANTTTQVGIYFYNSSYATLASHNLHALPNGTFSYTFSGSSLGVKLGSVASIVASSGPKSAPGLGASTVFNVFTLSPAPTPTRAGLPASVPTAVPAGHVNVSSARSGDASQWVLPATLVCAGLGLVVVGKTASGRRNSA